MEGSGGSVTKVHLPAGVTINAGRETSEVNSHGTVVQGMTFAITLPNGGSTSVFVPYSEIHNTAKVQELISTRVNSILAITS